MHVLYTCPSCTVIQSLCLFMMFRCKQNSKILEIGKLKFVDLAHPQDSFNNAEVCEAHCCIVGAPPPHTPHSHHFYTVCSK
jgi:hypothetical protein